MKADGIRDLVSLSLHEEGVHLIMLYTSCTYMQQT